MKEGKKSASEPVIEHGSSVPQSTALPPEQPRSTGQTCSRRHLGPNEKLRGQAGEIKRNRRIYFPGESRDK